MKKFISICLIFMLSIIPQTVSAKSLHNDTSKLSIEQEVEIRDALKKSGTDKTVEDNLINKLKRGEIWDSMNPDKLAELPPDALKVSAEEPVKKYTFPDGSFIKMEIEAISNEIVYDEELLSNKSSSYMNDGSQYRLLTGLLISYSGSTFNVKFKADIVLVKDGADGIVRKPYEQEARSTIFNISDEYIDIQRQEEDPITKIPAYAYYRFKASALNISSQTRYLKLYVGNDTYWSSFE